MKNYLFITNSNKTLLYNKIADELSCQKDVNVYWIVTSKKYISLVQPKNYLLINRGIDLNSYGSSIEIESLNEILYSDRILGCTKNDKKILEVSAEKIYLFIKGKKINYIIGELTTSIELITYRVIKQYFSEVKYLMLQNFKLYKDNFVVLSDEYLKTEHVFENINNDVTVLGQNKIGVAREASKIAKTANRKFKIKGILDHFVKIFIGKDYPLDDLTVPDSRILQRLIRGANKVFRFYYYKYFVKKILSDELPDKYILITLHKTPESSVDVVGRYYEDQLTNIINLWRKIPNDVYIVIKEHKSALGDRGKRFYGVLKSFTNILIVSEQSDIEELMKNALFVSSISGTSAFEAAKLGVKSVIFSDVYFAKLQMIKSITPKYLRSHTFDELLNDGFDGVSFDEFLEEMRKSTWKGRISDPLIDPSVLEVSNIQSIANFLKEI